MPHHGNRRPLRAALLAAATTLLALLPLAPSPAAAAGGGDHWAGSTVLENEGGTPRNTPPKPDGTQIAGMDVSGHQGDVDWQTAWNNGARFAYVKATEGTSYKNEFYGQQYNGSRAVGMIRGAYHFALPDRSSGAAQANFFLDNGGNWVADARTLPPALDIEYNPYGDTCFGKSQADMVAWIREFSNTVKARTGRLPTIYTTTDWWTTCTGNADGFGGHGLWLARYADSVGQLPVGWARHTIWQYADSGTFPGDQNWFNGTWAELEAYAKG